MKNNGHLLDFNQLYEMSEGDRVFYFNMLKMLKATCREGYENLSQSFRKRNYRKVAEQAHKLCSTFSHLNASAIRNDLIQIEDQCRSTPKDEISEQIDLTWIRLKNNLQKCMSEIEKEIQKN